MTQQLGGHFVDRIPHEYIASNRQILRRRLPYVLVLGDSWFDYPGRNADWFNNPTNVMEALAIRQTQPVNWFDAAIIGATTENLRRNLRLLRAFNSGRIKLAAILLSVGGNDYFEKAKELLVPYTGQTDAEACLNENGRKKPDQAIRTFIANLQKLRDQYQPQAPILTHGYLPPTVKSVGYRLLNFRLAGPWIKNAMEGDEGLGYEPASKQLKAEVKTALQTKLSLTIQQAISQGRHPQDSMFEAPISKQTLLQEEFWADEIHLSPKGYDKYTEEMVNAWQTQGVYPLGYV